MSVKIRSVGDVELLQPADRVLDVLQMTELTKVFEIDQDENQAIDSF